MAIYTYATYGTIPLRQLDIYAARLITTIRGPSIVACCTTSRVEKEIMVAVLLCCPRKVKGSGVAPFHRANGTRNHETFHAFDIHKRQDA